MIIIEGGRRMGRRYLQKVMELKRKGIPLKPPCAECGSFEGGVMCNYNTYPCCCKACCTRMYHRELHNMLPARCRDGGEVKDWRDPITDVPIRYVPYGEPELTAQVHNLRLRVKYLERYNK